MKRWAEKAPNWAKAIARRRGTPRPRHSNLYTRAVEETEGVTGRIQSRHAETPELEMLAQQFGAYIYFAGQKVIDLRVKTGRQRDRDEAIILCCPRLFNDCFAGRRLAKTGMVIQAIVLLRSAFETATQATLFMADEQAASRWLRRGRIKPREVRAKSHFAAGQKELYDRLARLSHPNMEGLQYFSAPAFRDGSLGSAQFYGGAFFPKAAGQISAQLLFAELVFLEAFYSHYQDDLKAQNLLWRPGPGPEVPTDFTWGKYLEIWRHSLTATLEKYNAMPNDAIELSTYVSSVLSSGFEWGANERSSAEAP